MIGLINEISISLSAPGMAAMKINKYLNLIIEMAKMLIENTMNSKEHILHSLEVYMAYSRKKLNLDTISSELMHGGNSITFYKMEMLIRDLRNASSDAPIFFSQNEFKNFETADYIFDEKTIKSLISKGIIKYDPEKFGYFLEGVRIPREMLPADLRDSTKQPVISIERGDLMGQLDINGDVNVIIKQFFEGLQQFTAKMEEIAGGAGGRSRSKGSKGASSDGEPGDVADAKKISEEGKKALDNLSSYVDLLEREKNLLREIKNLESEKTDESVDQINEKKK